MGWRYLVDFAEERAVKSHTVGTYIRRYPEKFDGHTQMDGKKMLIDEVAEEILSEIYRPLPPDQDWKGLQQERDYYLRLYVQGTQKNEKLQEKLDQMREWELEFKTLETGYKLQLAQEAESIAEIEVEKALKHAEEKKALELQLKDNEIEQLKKAIEQLKEDQKQLKEDHETEIQNMTFGQWLNRNKQK